MPNANLSRTKLNRTHLISAYLPNADLSSARMKRAYLPSSYLPNANLAGQTRSLNITFADRVSSISDRR